ncbi:MAG: DUF4381 family protein [Verrucomicrobiales bacterium]|nr:DUF4381 family protein [Verrucomicrobiales bacterium]
MIRTNLIEDLTLIPLQPWWQTPRGIVSLLGGLLAVSVVAWLVFRWWSRRVPPSPAPAPEPDRTADFLARLDALRGRKEAVTPHDFAFECSEVLREYVEWRYRLGIRFQTTREFLDAALDRAELGAEQRGVLGEYLRFCDRVKFARQEATPAEEDQLIETAAAVVRKGAAR